jgi:hypothetical protein
MTTTSCRQVRCLPFRRFCSLPVAAARGTGIFSAVQCGGSDVIGPDNSHGAGRLAGIIGSDQTAAAAPRRRDPPVGNNREPRRVSSQSSCAACLPAGMPIEVADLAARDGAADAGRGPRCMSSLFSRALRVRGAVARGSGEHAGDGRATGTIPHTDGNAPAVSIEWRHCPPR